MISQIIQTQATIPLVLLVTQQWEVIKAALMVLLEEVVTVVVQIVEIMPCHLVVKEVVITAMTSFRSYLINRIIY